MEAEPTLPLSSLSAEIELPAPVPEELAVEQALPLAQRIWNCGTVRKTLIFLLMAAAWEGYARYLNNPLLVPSLLETVRALVQALLHQGLALRILTSLKVLLLGYCGGIVAAAVLTFLAVTSRLGADLLDTLTAMFNPLPAIALLPLALVWFGLGTPSIVFVLVHSVLWPIALNTHAGFAGVSRTLRMVGRNYGLGGVSFIARILVPAAFPSILTGLKVGWAFAWRTLIAAELVFGVSSGSGGIGWFIYEKKNELEIASVFAGLCAVIIIGLAVERLIFQTIEARTVARWGMRHQERS